MLSILALLTVVQTSQAQQPLLLEAVPSTQYRWYHDTALPLRLDGRHLMLLGTSGAQVLEQCGLNADDFVPGRPDWTLAVVPPEQRSERSIAALAAEIANGEGDVMATPVFVDDFGGALFALPEVFVAFEHSVTSLEAEAIIAAAGAFEVLERDTAGMRDVWRLRSLARDGFTELAAVNALAETRGVRFAEPDWCASVRKAQTPTDPQYVNAWALNNTGQTTTAATGGGTLGIDMNAPEAWDFTKGSGVIVMVMDDGVQLNHPDITVSHFQDFTSTGGGGGPVNAWDNHGTAVAGCIAARMNGIDTVGLAPEATIAAAKVLISTGATSSQGQSSWVVDALHAAQLAGVRVTNSSWSVPVTNAVMEQKFADTRNAGMVHFAASGNDNTGTVCYPASIGSQNAVGAIDWSGNRATFDGGCANGLGGSNWGTNLWFVAPGEDVLTTDRTGLDGYAAGDFRCTDGTSYATPYAAAAAALVISRNSGLDAPSVENILRDNARDLGPAGYDTTFGWGCIDAQKALQHTFGPPVTYCTAGTTGNGCLASMSATGAPSASATSGFVLRADNINGGMAGLIFYGTHGRIANQWWPGSSSFLCVKGPVQRTGGQFAGGAPGGCGGALSLDWLAYMAAHPGALGSPVTAGTTVDAQAWFRDVNSPGTTSTSNAIEFIVAP